MAKLKQIRRNATIAWSPVQHSPNLLASATRTGVTTDSFDNAASIDIYSFDASSAHADLSVVGTTALSDRVQDFAWGAQGTRPLGLIAGAFSNGSLSIWDPEAIVTNAGTPLISTTERHTGPVQNISIDFNPLQRNLLASGAGSSELFIWDLSRPDTPNVYTPGPTQASSTNVSCVRWNRAVAHVLGAASYSGNVVVWNLKNKLPIMNFSDPSRAVRCRAIAWHPTEPLEIACASEDDASPYIQIWDLRYAQSPAKYLQGHTRGIWGLSWSSIDPSYLLSCSKDNRTICWDVKQGIALSDIEQGDTNNDVRWSPYLPSIIATSSVEGDIKVLSAHDVGNTQVKSLTAPKWLLRPMGASFGFGGKLISFRNKGKGTIQVHNVPINPELAEQSDQLDSILSSGQLQDFCSSKIEKSTNEAEADTWTFLKFLFEENPRKDLLNRLGFDASEIERAVKEFADSHAIVPEPAEPATEVTNTEADVDTLQTSEKEQENEETTTEAKPEDVSDLFGSTGDPFGFGSTSAADPFSAVAASAFDSLIPSSSSSTTTSSLFDVPTSSTLSGTPSIIELARKVTHHLTFSTGNDTEGVITRALLVGNFSAAVDCCLAAGKMADALVLAACGGPELWAKTQEAYFTSQARPFIKMVSYIVNHDLKSLVIQTDLNQWQVTLALLCTYSTSDDFPVLCGNLAALLEHSGNLHAATLCYICANDLENTVRIWALSCQDAENPLVALQSLIEKASVFQQAIHQPSVGPLLAAKYTEYAALLTSEGRLVTAQKYLAFARDAQSDSPAAILLDRINNAHHPQQHHQQQQQPPSSMPSIFDTDSSSNSSAFDQFSNNNPNSNFGFVPDYSSSSFNYSLNESARFGNEGVLPDEPTVPTPVYAPPVQSNAVVPTAAAAAAAVNSTYNINTQPEYSYRPVEPVPPPTTPTPTPAPIPITAAPTPAPVEATTTTTTNPGLAEEFSAFVDRLLTTTQDTKKKQILTNFKTKVPALRQALAATNEHTIQLLQSLYSNLTSGDKAIAHTNYLALQEAKFKPDVLLSLKRLIEL